MAFTTTYKGKDDQGGWLVLDFAGADTDGVSKIYIPYSELDQLRKNGDRSSARLRAARALFGELSTTDEEDEEDKID